MTHPSSTWTPEAVKQLSSYWDEGFSCSVIAKMLGNGATRNAVIGKVRRLGLPMRVSPAGTLERGSKREKTFTPPPKPKKPEPAPVAPAVAERPPAVASAPVVTISPPALARRTSAGVGVLDLRADDCRWPIGDPGHPDFTFCACSKVIGASYCEQHLRMSVGAGTESERSAVKLPAKVRA